MSEKQLEDNYNKFIEILNRVFAGNRLKKLLHMYSMDELGPNLMLSPASTNIHFHNAYEGGYIDHILNVLNTSFEMLTLYKKMGGICTFTNEELAFAAIHHDLGKLGEKDGAYYVPNESKWHVTNRGAVYQTNTKITYMTPIDRTFFLLNLYGIKYNEIEYFGIKLTDGAYDDENSKYLRQYNHEKHPRTNIQYVLHWADHMCTTIERANAKKK